MESYGNYFAKCQAMGETPMSFTKYKELQKKKEIEAATAELDKKKLQNVPVVDTTTTKASSVQNTKPSLSVNPETDAIRQKDGSFNLTAILTDYSIMEERVRKNNQIKFYKEKSAEILTFIGSSNLAEQISVDETDIGWFVQWSPYSGGLPAKPLTAFKPTREAAICALAGSMEFAALISRSDSEILNSSEIINAGRLLKNFPTDKKGGPRPGTFSKEMESDGPQLITDSKTLDKLRQPTVQEAQVFVDTMESVTKEIHSLQENAEAKKETYKIERPKDSDDPSAYETYAITMVDHIGKKAKGTRFFHDGKGSFIEVEGIYVGEKSFGKKTRTDAIQLVNPDGTLSVLTAAVKPETIEFFKEEEETAK